MFGRKPEIYELDYQTGFNSDYFHSLDSNSYTQDYYNIIGKSKNNYKSLEYISDNYDEINLEDNSNYDDYKFFIDVTYLYKESYEKFSNLYNSEYISLTMFDAEYYDITIEILKIIYHSGDNSYD